MNPVAKITGKMGNALMRCKPVAKAVRVIGKKKPELLAVSGGVLIVVAFGWAIYEAVGLKDVLNETSDAVKAVEDGYSNKLSKEMPDEEREEIRKQYKKELRLARTKGIWRVGKRFTGPAITLAVGMGLGTSGFKVLRKRNIMLGTALKGTEEAYKLYRQNVRDDLGKEADLKYARSIVGEQEIEKTTTDEKGNDIKVKKKIPVAKTRNNPWLFEYSEDWFDSYQEDSDTNLSYLQLVQNYWNHEYNRGRGIGGISMYDILQYLGYKFYVLKEGLSPEEYKKRMDFLRNNGWWKGSNGDGFIDLGLYKAINEPARHRRSDVVFIEMNCDGPLFE